MEAKQDINKMGRTRKSVWVSVLIIMLVEGWFSECDGCWKQERDALLHLKAISSKVKSQHNYWLNTWVDGTDCCQWENIECNTRRRVSKLNLHRMRDDRLENWYLNLSDFQAFDDIKSLDLTDNSIAGFVENKGNVRFSWQTKLEGLDLSDNQLTNDIISFLSGFHHLKSLDLSYNELEGSFDISVYLAGICAFSKLEMLALSFNYNINGFVVSQGTNICLANLKILLLNELKIDGTLVAGEIGDMEKLEHLELDGSFNIGNEFFKSIGALTSLKVLSLSSCGIKGSLPFAGWSELTKLEEFDISNNELEGQLGLFFINMTSLQKLDLSNNSFTGNFDSSLATLTSLEYLDFSSNQFEVLSSFNFLANYSSLKVIDGSGNTVISDPYPSIQTWVPKFKLQMFKLSSTSGADSIPLPNFLIHQYNLTDFIVSNSKFRGNFPNWLLENNTKIVSLGLGNCSFTGHFQLPPHVNPYLDTIIASYNMIIGQFPSNISTIFPNLKHLEMSANAMNGSLPLEFGPNLWMLDLSDNNFSGEMPRNISVHGSLLEILKLSNNKLVGSVCPTLVNLKILRELFLDGNSFSSSIPSCLFNASLLLLMDISNNHFVGKLPNDGIRNLSNLQALSMAGNHLEGSISTEIIEQRSLKYLDLSRNDLSDSVPSFVHSKVRYVLLNNNRFSGFATAMFNRSLPLIMLDLSNNNITGKIHHLIGNISQLNILLLRGNNFIDQIPNHMCQLKNLELVDISYNSLSGPIPNCLSKFPSETQEWQPFFSNEIDLEDTENSFPFDYSVELRVTFTTKWRSYTYEGSIIRYMSGMDFSHNNLNGSIPSELGNLMHIRVLNLSHNHLSGQIPMTFSNLKQVESLDLSFNNLSGKIPPQLIELTSLEVFSLAHNNLSGSTPRWKGQFMTFDASSYEGNSFLCGPPLNKSCTPYGIFTNAFDVEAVNNGGIVDMEFFYISFVVSYTSILFEMAAVLYIKPQLREAWFYFIESIISYCHYYFREWFPIQHM